MKYLFALLDFRQKLILALFATAVFHIIYNMLLPLHPDEAYYWLWSKQIDWSYYDHPAMIAWMIKVFSIFGDSESAVRLATVFCMSVACYALSMTAYRALYSIAAETTKERLKLKHIPFLLLPFWKTNARYLALAASASAYTAQDKDALEVKAEKAAWLTFIAFSIIPAAMFGYTIVTPDSPLIMFWCLAIYWGFKAILGDGDKYFILTGIAISLMIVSKYTAVLFPISLFFYILLFKRTLFANKFTWLACFIGITGIIPILIWNMQHEWISITFQYKHGTSDTFKILWGKFFELFGGIQLLPTPIFAFIIYKIVFYVKDYRKDDWWRFLSILFIVPTAFFLYKGLFKKMELNWPIIGFLSTFPMMAIYVAEGFHKKLFKAGAIFAAALSLILIIMPILPLPDSINLSLRIKGTKEAVMKLEKIRTTDPEEKYFSNHLTVASMMAYYLKDHPRVYIPVRSRFSQFDLWDKGVDYSHMHGYYLGHSDEKGQLEEIFKNVTFMEKIPTGSKNNPKYFYLYKVVNN